MLETPVSTLLGETIPKSKSDEIKIISKKLEIINLQLSKRKDTRRRILFWLLISLCILIIITYIALFILNSPYLNWDYSIPETAVVGVTFHIFEWLFVRITPIILIVLVVGIFLTRKTA